MYGTDYPDPIDPGPDDNPTQDDHAARLLALVRTGDWLDAQEFPPLRWAVFGLIPEGFGILTGPPKAGKSWAAFGVGLAVAAGGRAFGKVPTGDPRPVLYLALEDGYARLQGRARHLLGEGGTIPSALHVVTRVTPADVVPLMGAWLDQHRGQAPLVLLDTLGKVMPPALPGEGAYQRDYRIGGKLKALTDSSPGSTLLVVHHTRKMAGEDWMDSTSGTNGLNGAADFTLNLARSRNEASGVLRVTGRDVVESEYAITSHEGLWTLDGATLADAAKAAQQARITEGLGDSSTEVIRIVGEHPEGIGPTQLARVMGEGWTPNKAGAYLVRLHEAGRIAKGSRGSYTPVESVESVETQHPDTPPFNTFNGFNTPIGDCLACGEPLHPSLVEMGDTLHVGCGVSA